MGLFNRKPKKVRTVHDGAWGHLVYDHSVSPETVGKLRIVEKSGRLKDNSQEVYFIRVFNPKEAAEKGVMVSGWDSLDKHPGLIMFEGYLTPHPDNTARLTRVAK